MIAIIALLMVGFVVAVVAAAIAVAVRQVKLERRRLEQFHVYAAQCGWRPVTSAVPGPVGEAARSRRTRLVLGIQQAFALWVVWHQWTESTGSGDSTTHTTRHLTQYFLWLGPFYPNVRVERRTGIGAFFKPVRGIGTADAEFDKRFIVRRPGEHEALRLLTVAVRQAMVAGYVPAWSIVGGVLILAYHDAPTVQTLQPRADTITYLARMLTHGGS